VRPDAHRSSLLWLGTSLSHPTSLGRAIREKGSWGAIFFSICDGKSFGSARKDQRLGGLQLLFVEKYPIALIPGPPILQSRLELAWPINVKRSIIFIAVLIVLATFSHHDQS